MYGVREKDISIINFTFALLISKAKFKTWPFYLKNNKKVRL